MSMSAEHVSLRPWELGAKSGIITSPRHGASFQYQFSIIRRTLQPTSVDDSRSSEVATLHVHVKVRCKCLAGVGLRLVIRILVAILVAISCLIRVSPTRSYALVIRSCRDHQLPILLAARLA